MSIEIREIKVVGSITSTPNQRMDTSNYETKMDLKAIEERIINKCVDKVLKIIEKNNRR